MKKHVEPNVAEVLDKMQQQLFILEKKIDTLINKTSPRPAEEKPYNKPFQQHSHSYNHGGGRQDNNYKERVLHKAICADCKKECEVPFRPTGERPVYCKDCFSKRKSGSSFKGRPDNRPREASHFHAARVDRPQSFEKNRPYEKKRAVKRPKDKRLKTK